MLRLLGLSSSISSSVTVVRCLHLAVGHDLSIFPLLLAPAAWTVAHGGQKDSEWFPARGVDWVDKHM